MKMDDAAKFYYQFGAIRGLEAIEDGSLSNGIPLDSGILICSEND